MESTFKDIVNVMLGNIITLMSGIVNGLALPYMLGTTNYGYYRIFILYSTYTALLHCGFVDGVLLKFSGHKYSSLDKFRFRAISISFIIFQLIVSCVLSFSSFFLNDYFYFTILFLLGIYTFISNILVYYTFISQITMRFNILSIRNSVQALISILLTLSICFLYKLKLIENINYKLFIYVLIFDVCTMLIWYICTYRHITFGPRYSLKIGFEDIYNLCKLGIYLTIAYQISNLVMIIDNQLVSMFFKANIYGKYSFSYGISSRALIILGAVSTVLLPHLKRDTFHHMISVYHRMISSMMLVVYLALLAYFPLCLLVHIILPEYIQSLSYLKVFLPELGITCSVTMITFNYYNALGKSKFYFYMSMVILAISAVIDLIMYILFHTPISIALGSFIAIFIWYMASEYFLVKWYHVQWIKNFIYMILMIGSFFLSSMIGNLVVGFCTYLIIYLIISWLMFNDVIKKNVKILVDKL